MRFECEACAVRSWRWSDVYDLPRHANTPAVADRMLRIPYPYRRWHAAAFIGFVELRRAMGRPEMHFAIEANRELAGGIGLAAVSGVSAGTAELSYWLGEPFWGRGIASAAVRCLTPYAFRILGLNRIVALPFADNRASCRVLEKAGFEREALQRGSAARHGVVHDQWLYALGDVEVAGGTKCR